ncbi:MAG: hypothetical protein AAFP79_13175 [Pseudomonadota bacterium]
MGGVSFVDEDEFSDEPIEPFFEKEPVFEPYNLFALEKGEDGKEIEYEEPLHEGDEDDFFLNQNNQKVLFQEVGALGPGQKGKEVGRNTTRERGDGKPGCQVEAFFGLEIKGRLLGGRFWKKARHLRFSRVQPELSLSSNVQVTVQIAVRSIGDFPGSLEVSVTRRGTKAAGTTKRTFKGTKVQVEKKMVKARGFVLTPPTKAEFNGKSAIIETLTTRVCWTPDGGDTCCISPAERLIIRWTYASNRSQSVIPTPQTKGHKSKKGNVYVGPTLVPPDPMNGSRFFEVPLQIYYPIEAGNACCGEKREHTVIQFVRHEWYLKGAPIEHGTDTWSLDILESEIARANDSNNPAYDPTFTHNPRGSKPKSEPLTYPGPDPNGKASFVQIDGPGISPEVYKRFRDAKSGSTFTFHFMAFVVCKLTPSTASQYLTKGHVVATMQYRIQIQFKGKKAEPVIARKVDDLKKLKKCEPFKDALADFTKKVHKHDKPIRDRIERLKRRNPVNQRAVQKQELRLHGSPENGYKSPHPHKVALPR